MDKAKANKLIALVRATLGPVLEKEGVILDFSQQRYNHEMTRFRVILTERKATPAKPDDPKSPDMPPEEADFRRYHAEFGLKLTDLHRKVQLGNGRKRVTMRITGLLPKAHKNIIAITDEKGKGYKTDLVTIKRALALAEAVPEAPKAKRSEAEILTDLRNVELDLDPENLEKDGEATREHINREKRRLTLKKEELIAELGRTPTDKEIWGA